MPSTCTARERHVTRRRTTNRPPDWASGGCTRVVCSPDGTEKHLIGYTLSMSVEAREGISAAAMRATPSRRWNKNLGVTPVRTKIDPFHRQYEAVAVPANTSSGTQRSARLRWVAPPPRTCCPMPLESSPSSALLLRLLPPPPPPRWARKTASVCTTTVPKHIINGTGCHRVAMYTRQRAKTAAT